MTRVRDRSPIVLLLGGLVVVSALARGAWAVAVVGAVLAVGGAWAVRHYARKGMR